MVVRESGRAVAWVKSGQGSSWTLSSARMWECRNCRRVEIELSGVRDEKPRWSKKCKTSGRKDGGGEGRRGEMFWAIGML